MLKSIATKIKSFFIRKRTQLQVIKYTAPKEPNPLFHFLLVNALFVSFHILLFPEYSVIEALIIGLIVTTSLSKQARHFVRHTPELVMG